MSFFDQTSKYKKFNYDVAISFAGEDRNLAKKLANSFVKQGLEVFFDEYFKAQLWGKNLYEHLSKVYSEEARYCLLLISEHYIKKVWTNHELKSAQVRALNEINGEYILPVRIDDTAIVGIPQTIGFLDMRDSTVEQISALLFQKIGHIDKITDFNQAKLPFIIEYIKVSSDLKLTSVIIKISLSGVSTIEAAEGDNVVDAVLTCLNKATSKYYPDVPEIEYFKKGGIHFAGLNEKSWENRRLG